jgi:hypothetical protein
MVLYKTRLQRCNDFPRDRDAAENAGVHTFELSREKLSLTHAGDFAIFGATRWSLWCACRIPHAHRLGYLAAAPSTVILFVRASVGSFCALEGGREITPDLGH